MKHPRMKNSRLLLALLISIAMICGAVSTAFAVPPLPSSFYGTIEVAGVKAPVGAKVSAWVNGVQFAFGTTVDYLGDTVYSLDVPGDDLSTPAIEGGVDGNLIVFKVNGQPANETGVWHSGTNVPLNLNVTKQPYIYLPVVTKP
jgi:hypothetical protein